MSIPNEVRQAVKQLGIEIRIMSALAAYAEEAGSDNEIESWQSYRVFEAFDELKTLIDQELPSKQ